jgi:hypothetical protein
MIVISTNSDRKRNLNQPRFGIAIMAVRFTVATSCRATEVLSTYTDGHINKGFA